MIMVFCYKLLNKLFGWDYIYWRGTFTFGISRVRIDPNGDLWFWKDIIICNRDEISKPDDVKWLTCKPDKYFKSE